MADQGPFANWPHLDKPGRPERPEAPRDVLLLPSSDTISQETNQMASNNTLENFLGGSPLNTFARLLVISLVVGALLMWLELRPIDIFRGVQAFFDRWTESSGDTIQPTVDIMLEVKAAGYPVYGLSNWSTESFPWVKHKYTFLSQLDDYLLSGMVGVAKPDLEIFRLFLQRIHLQAEECVFIDDSQANIDAALRLGFTGILYRSAPELRTYLETLGILDGKSI